MMRWGDVVQGGGVVLAVGGRRGFWGVMICGPPRSGKMTTLFSALRKLPNMEVVGLNFSSATLLAFDKPLMKVPILVTIMRT